MLQMYGKQHVRIGWFGQDNTQGRQGYGDLRTLRLPDKGYRIDEKMVYTIG